MEVEAIKKILESHKKWLIGDGGKCANLAYANLKDVNLAYANLAYANLTGTNFAGANLAGAYLAGANLANADLTGANLIRATLVEANLAGAKLIGTYLDEANLTSAHFTEANLTHANLTYANLACADLRGANLKEINFAYAHLAAAKNISYIPFACPSDGAFIGWKKANEKIIKLQILEDSKRVSATTRKCRCNKAYVMEIQDIDGNKLEDTEISSNYDSGFVYRVGEIVEVKDFYEDRWRECSAGIHFFANRQDAVDY